MARENAGIAAEADTPASTSDANAMAFISQPGQRSITMLDTTGRVLGTKRVGHDEFMEIKEQNLAAALRGNAISTTQCTALWEFFANDDHAALVSPTIVKALITACHEPKSRAALWSELGGQATALAAAKASAPAQSLVGILERNRTEFRPLLGDTCATEATCDDMIKTMVGSRIFGDHREESVAYLTERIPAPVARYIERERGSGRPVAWEYPAFEAMIRWKQAHLVPRAPKAPATLADFDAAGETFISIFNFLHALDDGYREVILRGLGPVEIYNAVVAGEKQLYLLGTSGYRDFLHAIILRGIKESGSFEAFADRAVPRRLGPDAVRSAGRRSMVYIRIAAAFGLLDSILITVRDQDRFIESAMDALGDPTFFEANSSVVMDIVTGRTGTPRVAAFRRALLDRLYQRYETAQAASLRSVYGSMLSVYQTVTGDHRVGAIGQDFVSTKAAFEVPFDRLFSAESKGRYQHTMFMRLGADVDDVTTYKLFRAAMNRLGATVTSSAHYDSFRVSARNRVIDIYANKPTVAGLRQGIPAIAEALEGRRVETVIGRGHTQIIDPLQKDAKRLLGNRIKDVAAVIVGACGGDASVRDMITTFGYVPIIATKSTGRQIINDTIIADYIAALKEVAPDGHLNVNAMLDRAVNRFGRPEEWGGMAADAHHYNANMTTVLTARLFDTHVQQQLDRAAPPDPTPPAAEPAVAVAPAPPRPVETGSIVASPARTRRDAVRTASPPPRRDRARPPGRELVFSPDRPWPAYAQD